MYSKACNLPWKTRINCFFSVYQKHIWHELNMECTLGDTRLRDLAKEGTVFSPECILCTQARKYNLPWNNRIYCFFGVQNLLCRLNMECTLVLSVFRPNKNQIGHDTQ